jgi:hypothetical protein
MSLSTLDKIKLKTQQILVKTDDYLTTTKHGMDASHHGIMFAGVSIIAGITGVMAIVAAPTLPAIAGVAALASMPTFAVGGAAVNLAGASLLGGGAAGLAFTAFAKMYKSVKGDRDYYVNGELECLPKGSSNPNEFVKVDRKEVLKSIENGTFNDKFELIKVENFHNPGEHFKIKLPKEKALEIIASQPYLISDKVIKPDIDSWIEDCQKVRRECFKEAKNFDLKASIMNRINNFREKIEGESVKKKYTI